MRIFETMPSISFEVLNIDWTATSVNSESLCLGGRGKRHLIEWARVTQKVAMFLCSASLESRHWFPGKSSIYTEQRLRWTVNRPASQEPMGGHICLKGARVEPTVRIKYFLKRKCYAHVAHRHPDVPSSGLQESVISVTCTESFRATGTCMYTQPGQIIRYGVMSQQVFNFGVILYRPKLSITQLFWTYFVELSIAYRCLENDPNYYYAIAYPIAYARQHWQCSAPSYEPKRINVRPSGQHTCERLKHATTL